MKNAVSTQYHLDNIDKEIIYMLMDNAKTSLAHISKNVGISTTAVHQRIKKLEQAGVIENSISFLIASLHHKSYYDNLLNKY